MKDDAELRRAYESLVRQRGTAGAPVDPDEVKALAEHPPTDAAGMERLDAILANPQTRDEYFLLRDVATRSAALSRPQATWRWTALAAAAVVAIAVVPLLRRSGGEPPDQLRSDSTIVLTAATNSDSAWAPGVRLAWTAAGGAATYEVQALDANANVFWTTTSRDTTTIIPADAARPTGTRITVRVTAREANGAERRGRPRTFIAR